MSLNEFLVHVKFKYNFEKIKCSWSDLLKKSVLKDE